MANLLSNPEAYIACMKDVQKAQALAARLVETRMIPAKNFDQVFQREFVRLCENRIVCGELEAFLPGGLRIVDRATEAA